MRVLVTRPQAEAERWVASLNEAGFAAQALPLIAVRASANVQAVQAAWSRLPTYTAVLFVSANAIRHFFEQKTGLALEGIGFHAINTRAMVTGPGSYAALRRAGVAADCIDAPSSDALQFDSEALWAVVGTRMRAGQRVLIVRGAAPEDRAGPDATQGSGRDWFARQLQAVAVTVDYVVSYERVLPVLSETELALLRTAATDGSVWLFSSAQALRNLRRLAPEVSWAQARAVVTHPRIAAAAAAAGFAAVQVSRPAMPALLASIESLG